MVVFPMNDDIVSNNILRSNDVFICNHRVFYTTARQHLTFYYFETKFILYIFILETRVILDLTEIYTKFLTVQKELFE